MTPVSIKGALTDSVAPAIATGAVAGVDDAAAGGDFLAAMLEAPGPSSDVAPDASDAPADASALALVAIPLPVAGLVAPPDGGAVPGTGPALAQGHANVAEATAVTPTGPAGDIRMSAYEAGSPATATPATGEPSTVATASPESPAARTTDVSASGAPHGVAESAESRTVLPAADQDAAAQSYDTAPAHAPADTDEPPAASGTQSTGLSSTPVAGPAVPAASSPHDATPAQHVTRQVIPEVTSLMSRGDGTRRITLALKPEALGEVRVVMTVRDGSVHVRLAAGQEAQRALLEGSPELTRLLDAAGVGDTRVTVRDLSTGAPAASGTAADLGAGGNAAQDQHAGTRAQHPATDGTHDGTRHRRAAAGANPPRSNEPVTRTRTAGVDVTM
jgi:flagellar hook-length control protein FliK